MARQATWNHLCAGYIALAKLNQIGDGESKHITTAAKTCGLNFYALFSPLLFSPNRKPICSWHASIVDRSFDRQWKDNSSELSEAEKLDENQACQSLLVIISGILGQKSSLSRYLSYEDLEICELFKWERTMLEQ